VCRCDRRFSLSTFVSGLISLFFVAGACALSGDSYGLWGALCRKSVCHFRRSEYNTIQLETRLWGNTRLPLWRDLGMAILLQRRRLRRTLQGLRRARYWRLHKRPSQAGKFLIFFFCSGTLKMTKPRTRIHSATRATDRPRPLARRLGST
jgi:hypothetical protein